MNIIIGGDLVPTKSNESQFINGNVKCLVGSEILALLERADFRVFNLETPISDRPTPIKKCGPNLIAKTETLNAFKKMNIDLVTLANNHILDQGASGINNTISALNNYGINYFGVGEDINSVKKTESVAKDGVSVGFYSCVEHEFSVATISSPGANPFDPLYVFDDVERLKMECNYVIVLFHGGKEYFQYPSPELQRICRRFVEKGADIVICQHSHCIGCMEKYEKGTIIYGQGNFLFNNTDKEISNSSLLLSIDFTEEVYKLNYIPIVKNNLGVLLGNENEKKIILDNFWRRSEEITKEAFVERTYAKFASSMYFDYIRKIRGRNTLLDKIVFKLTKNKSLNLRYRENEILTIENIISCESHRELLLEALKNWAKRNPF